MKQIEEITKEWIKRDFDEESKKRVLDLLEKKDFEQLKGMMYPRIEFGTAGLRSRMDAGFANMNRLIVGETSYALAQYVLSVVEGAKEKGVVIGYDGRYGSKDFAHLTALVFQLFGFKVYLFGRIVGTPYVPYGVLQLKAACGIMITASHNPKQDNGYKLYWENGCQIVSPHDVNISKAIENLPEIDWNSIIAQVLKSEDPYQIISKNYMNDIRKFSFSPLPIEKQGNITYTAMHGVGTPFLLGAFEVFGLKEPILVKEQVEIDPEFSTVQFPNPEEGAGALKLAIKTADANDSNLILAHDPDADRLAVAEKIDGQWNIFNGNEIALLLADWIGSNFKKRNPNFDFSKCVMINSTVSSKALRSLCQVEGFTYADSLTGFKWIGNKAHDFIQKGYTFLLGYEVEIGFCIGECSLDKDGIRAAAVFAEMANFHFAKKTTLTAHLQTLYKRYGFYVMNTRYFFAEDISVQNKIFDEIRKPDYPKTIGKFQVKYIRDLMTGYDNEQKDHKPILPPSQMITFTLEDGSTLTLRPSGTEPKLKYYIECCSDDPKIAEDKVSLLKKAMIEELLKPEQNGLIDPDSK